MNPVALSDLHHSDYEHPLDSRSLNMLEGTPGLQRLARSFVKLGIERFMVVSYTGSNLRVTENNFPKLVQVLREVCATINVHRLPQLYIEWNDSVGGLTVGDDEPIIVITSGSVDRLTDDEMRFLLGHEMGHIKSRHTRYHMLAASLSTLSVVVGDLTLGLGKLLSAPLRLALHRWYRMSELSADRLGLLACQSLPVAGSVFVKVAGLPQRFNDSPCVDDFLAQARDFQEIDMDNLNRWAKLAAHMMHSHPWTVSRTSELVRWFDSGQYDALLHRGAVAHGLEPETVKSREDSQCAACGSKIEKDDLFCAYCGRRITEMVTPEDAADGLSV